MTELRIANQPQSTPATSRPASAKPPLPTDSAHFLQPPVSSRLVQHVAGSVAKSLESELAESLAQELRCDVRIAPIRAIDRSFGEFAKSLPPPRTVWPLGSQPAGVIYASPSLTFSILARILGDTESTAPPLARTFTVLEERLLQSPISLMVQPLTRALGIDSREIAPNVNSSDAAKIFASIERIITLDFNATIAACSGSFTILLREAFLESLVAKHTRDAILNRSTSPPALAGASIQLGAVAATTTLSPEELRALKPGDVITTAAKCDAKVHLELDAGATLEAQAVQFRGARAIVGTTLRKNEALR